MTDLGNHLRDIGNEEKGIVAEFFTPEERSRLGIAVCSDGPRMPIRDYYQRFRINPEESRIIQHLNSKDRGRISDHYSYIISLFPKGEVTGVKTYLDYKIPEAVFDVALEHIQTIKENKLAEYKEALKKQDIPKQFRNYGEAVKNRRMSYNLTEGEIALADLTYRATFLKEKLSRGLAQKKRSFIQQIFSFSTFVASAGMASVVFDNQGAYENTLARWYQKQIDLLREQTPIKAELLLQDYLKWFGKKRFNPGSNCQNI